VDLPPPPQPSPLPADAADEGPSADGSAPSHSFSEVPDFSSLLADIDLDAPAEDLSQDGDIGSADLGDFPDTEAETGRAETESGPAEYSTEADLSGEFPGEEPISEPAGSAEGDFDFGAFAAAMMSDSDASGPSEALHAPPEDQADAEASLPQVGQDGLDEASGGIEAGTDIGAGTDTGTGTEDIGGVDALGGADFSSLMAGIPEEAPSSASDGLVDMGGLTGGGPAEADAVEPEAGPFAGEVPSFEDIDFTPASQDSGLGDMGEAAPEIPEAAVPDDSFEEPGPGPESEAGFSMPSFDDIGLGADGRSASEAVDVSVASDAEEEAPAASHQGDEGSIPSFEDFSASDFGLDAIAATAQAPRSAVGDEGGEAGPASLPGTFAREGDEESIGFDLGGESREEAPARAFGHRRAAKPKRERIPPPPPVQPPEAEEAEAGEAAPADSFAGFEFGAAPPDGLSGGEESADDLTGLSLSEKELDRLQDSLLSYPLNLRLEIERGLAEEGLDDRQAAKIVELMVAGAGAREMASQLGHMLGKRIPIPKGFERRTGEQLEAEAGSFWYAFRKNILPLLGVSLAVIAGLALLVLAGYHLVYKPLLADSIYREGYRAISADDYPAAEDLFDRAYSVRAFKSWHYRYARAYVVKKQYFLAEKKYQEILSRYGREKKAAMEYARLESEVLLDYAKAESVLKRTILNWRPKDADALLLHGDNYLAWSDDTADTARRAELLEAARKAYASLVRMYGRKDLYMGRMLLYFIRADKLSEVLPLREWLLKEKDAKVDARVYGELGGYLIDRGQLEGVQVILKTGLKRDQSDPDLHYQLARLFRATAVHEEERKALAKALEAYDAKPALTKNQVAARIDVLHWSGQWRFKAAQYLEAEFYYFKAIQAYEAALAKRYVEPGPRFGEIYAGLGDVHYYDRNDLSTAFDLYQEAARNGYSTRETAYKRGYVNYRRGQYAQALDFLYEASLEASEEDNLLYAMANSFYRREDFAAAAGYYERLVQRMNDEIDRFAYQDVQDRPQQRRVVNLLMVASNNLGVALYRLSLRLGDSSRRSQAMAQLSESARLYDALTRDQKTMIRDKQANLAYLNLDGILHPSRAFVPQIYAGISRDLVDTDEQIAIDAMLYSGGL
jgi:tetratricopeptide (TPR) repeat protein